jgi:WD40 repeat protein
MNRDGTRALTCSWDKTAKLWSIADKSLPATLCPNAPIDDCALSPEGKTAALTSDSVVQIRNAETETLLSFQPNDDDVYSLEFSPDNRRLASCTTGGSVAFSASAKSEWADKGMSTFSVDDWAIWVLRLSM